MKTVGEFLREERLKQNKDLEYIAQKTKIRPTILKHIENGSYDKLPSRTYVHGFVRAYAIALGIDVEKALAFFRREYDVAAAEDRPAPEPLEKPGFIITPAKVLTAVGSLVLVAFFVFLFIQYRQFAGRPVLLLEYPPEQLTIDQEFVNVSGRTDPENEILINGETVTVSADGTFQITVTLHSGINSISIVARNNIGRETLIEREVQVVARDQ